MPNHFADSSPDTHHFLEGPLMRAPKEVGCAFAASMLVSPIVSIMDKAMVKPMKGLGAFFGEMGTAGKQMCFEPRAFFGGLSFRLTLIVYFGTYAVANMAELALDQYRIRHPEQRKQVKVSAASVANIGLLAWRDSVFAREFGGGKPKASTPIRTISLFAVRDCATMWATFYAAPKVAEYLMVEHDVNKDVAELSMALAIPVAMQVVTAPVHIHALDYYARPVATTSERLAQINLEFGKISFARSLRILPAFGIGSYSNNKFRELFIRQPDEELLLKTKLTRRITALRHRYTKQVQN